MARRLLWFALFLILAAATTRVLRHLGFIDLPPNVAPIAALALFGGTYLPRRLAFVLPLAAMLVSDALIGFYHPAIMASVYGSFMVSGALGVWLRTRKNLGTVIAATLAGSVVFYLVTNAAVWAFGSLYFHSAPGLLQAYVAGLPFFRNTVLGDLGFVGSMFGAYEFFVLFLRKRRAMPELS